jgi:ELWxxDGT repeat protein
MSRQTASSRKKQELFRILAVVTSTLIFLTPLKAPSATAADPVPVLFAQINASESFDSEAPFRAVMGSTLFFAGKYTPAVGQQLGGVTEDVGRELWKTDGTNVSLVKDLNLGAGSSNPSNFTVAGQILYFLAGDGITEENDNEDEVNSVRDLWKTDGVTTTLVRESSSLPTNPTSMTAVGDVLYFVADDVGLGRELWKVTPSGVVSVIDLFDDYYGSYPEELTAVDETLFFTAIGDNDGNEGSLTGRELWKSDASTTSIVRDILVGTEGSSPKELTAVGSTLYFAADDKTGPNGLNPTGGNNEELWKSDGSSEGTVTVSDYSLGTPDINNAFTFKNNLYFNAMVYGEPGLLN